MRTHNPTSPRARMRLAAVAAASLFALAACAGTEDDDDVADPAGEEAASADPVEDDADSEAFCAELASQQEELAGPDSALTLIGDPPAYFEAVETMFSDLVAVAPPEIIDAALNGRDAVDAAADEDDGSFNAESLLTIASDEKYIEANQAIVDYGTDVCGLDITGFLNGG